MQFAHQLNELEIAPPVAVFTVVVTLHVRFAVRMPSKGSAALQGVSAKQPNVIISALGIGLGTKSDGGGRHCSSKVQEGLGLVGKKPILMVMR